MKRDARKKKRIRNTRFNCLDSRGWGLVPRFSSINRTTKGQRERTREEGKWKKEERKKKRNGIVEERKGRKRQEEVLALGTTRPVSKTRRAKPEGKGGRETLLPKIYGATGNTRTLLVTSWWTPRALTALYIYISYDTKTSRYFHLPSSRTRCLCPVHRSPVSFLCFSPADEARKLPGDMWPPPLCPRLPTLLLDLLLLFVVLHRPPLPVCVLDECTSPRCTCVRPSSSPSSSSTTRITHSLRPYPSQRS